MQSTFSKIRAGSILSIVFAVSLISVQIASATIYQPGETLEPDCAPGSPSCGVAIFSLNGQASSTQTFASSTSGTDFSISSLGNIHSFNLPSASAVNRGLLTSTDWSTFNGKQSILISGTNIKTVGGISLLGSGDIAVGGIGTVTSVTSANADLTVTSTTIAPVLTIVSAPKLTTARTIGGVSFDGTANITVASATGGFTISGGDLVLGTNSITMSGSLGTTGTRLTKGWFTDLQATNAIIGSITGNAATVTTNANLTGPITSVGNATSIGAQTGTGNTFVMNTSPTLVTPVLGVATATSINKLTITAPATGSTLTIDDSFTLHATGNVTALSGSHTGTSSGTNTGDQTTITGNAGTATALQNARTIGGVSFDGTANITVASATGAFTVSGALAANGGITFDSSTDTLGAFTLAGTLDAGTNIITNIGNAGTDFIASTGALTLAGILTANGGISIAANALTGTTGNIDYTNFDVIGSSGNTDIGGTITAGSANTVLTLSTGLIDADALTLTAAVDGGIGTSSGSGFIARSDGIGLLQGCTDGQILKWVESTDTWNCSADTTGSGADLQHAASYDTNEAVTNIPTGGAQTTLGTVSLTPSTVTGDIYVAGWADVYSNSGTDQPLQLVIETTNNCTGTTVGNATVTYTITSAASAQNDRGSIRVSGIAVDPGTGAQPYSLCAAVTSGAGNTDVLNWGIEALVIDTGSDLAEIYTTNDPSVEAGDVVALDPNLKTGVKKSTGAYDQNVLGIVSTRPGTLIGGVDKEGVGAVPVALSGRVPVKVVTENGDIAFGDYLTSSSIPGVAMKSNGTGPVIGQAIGSYSGQEVGKVLAFIKNFDLGDSSPSADIDIPSFQSETSHNPIAVIAAKMSEGKKLVSDFIAARVTAIRGYFDELFAKKIHTEELCLKKSDGSEVCVNGDQAQSMLNNVGASVSSPVEPTPEPTNPITPEVTPEVTPSIEVPDQSNE